MFWVLLLALFLRLINLNQSLWLDEAFQFKSTYFFSLKDLLTVYLPGDFNPPLSYLINFGFGKVFGYSEIALRLPSVIFGVLTVWLVYKISQRKIWPALLLATSGLHIYYSQEARMYSLATLAVTASFWFLLKKRWFWYAIFSLAALYSHYLTVFIFPAQLLLIKKKEIKKLILSWSGIALGFFPWLPIFLQQLAAGQATAGTSWGNVVGGLSLKALLLIPIKFLIGRIAIDNNLIFALVMAVPLLLTTWLVWRGVKSNKFFAAWLLLPLALIIIVSLKLPVLSYFRLLFLLPAFYLLLCVKTSRSVLVGFLVFNLATTGIYLFNPAFHREDWRGLARSLTDQPVVMIPAVNAPLKYYYSGEIIYTVPSAPEFWYIPYAEPIFDADLTLRQKIAAVGYQEISQNHFRGNLTLIQYKR